MELSEVIRKRRSIRRFDSEKEVTEEQIRQILDAGISAPSSKNSQCWHFIVIRDREFKKRVVAEATRQPFIDEAPVVIAVCADLNVVHRSSGDRGKDFYSLQDVAAAIENMLLTITDMGLASCWIGAFRDEALAEVLDLKEGRRPIALLPIGYGLESPRTLPKKSIDEVTDWK